MHVVRLLKASSRAAKKCKRSPFIALHDGIYAQHKRYVLFYSRRIDARERAAQARIFAVDERVVENRFEAFLRSQFAYEGCVGVDVDQSVFARAF